MQVGDRVTHLYGRPIDEVFYSLNRVPLIGPRQQAVPLVVERAGQTLTLAVDQGTPSLAFQISKLILAVLALICWLTGYLLGVVRRHDAPDRGWWPAFG